jgi:hypothetical protein
MAVESSGNEQWIAEPREAHVHSLCLYLFQARCIDRPARGAVSRALWLTQQGRLKATISCSALTARKTQSAWPSRRHSNKFQQQ